MDLKEKAAGFLKKIAATYNYTINEKRLPILAEKFGKQLEEHNAMYCPCQNMRTDDTICPCIYMRRHQACRCGLFSAKEGHNG